MGTLASTIGNELSHELGHNWGMGHYPNGFDGSVHRPADAINSTWGWDKDKNFFIPNFSKQFGGESTSYGDRSQTAFQGRHTYGKDAMAGGSPLYPSSNCMTLHTPYTSHKIQARLERKVSDRRRISNTRFFYKKVRIRLINKNFLKQTMILLIESFLRLS